MQRLRIRSNYYKVYISLKVNKRLIALVTPLKRSYTREAKIINVLKNIYLRCTPYCIEAAVHNMVAAEPLTKTEGCWKDYMGEKKLIKPMQNSCKAWEQTSIPQNIQHFSKDELSRFGLDMIRIYWLNKWQFMDTGRLLLRQANVR